MDEFDDIDRALFSLQLEEPPDDLRASILAVTVEAPREFVLGRPFSWLDLAVAGTALAFAVWLSSLVVAGHGGPSLETAIAQLGSALANPVVLAWLGAGASTAVWLSLANLTPLLAGVRSSRA
jgi:hypothetical protein